MALRYLLDEHFRSDIWSAILHHNAQAVESIDAVRVGDPADLPLSCPDSEILVWAERAGRVLISRDRRTMIAELRAQVQAGRTCPGLFIVRPRCRLADVLGFLVEAAQAGDEDQWRDQATYIPVNGTVHLGAFEYGAAVVTPTQLVATPQPPASIADSSQLNVSVAAQDGSGNTAIAFDRPVTVAIASGPAGGTLSGTLTETASLGVAAFSGLTFNEPGWYTLAVSGGGLSGTIGPIQVVAGKAVEAVATTEPPADVAPVRRIPGRRDGRRLAGIREHDLRRHGHGRPHRRPRQRDAWRHADGAFRVGCRDVQRPHFERNGERLPAAG